MENLAFLPFAGPPTEDLDLRALPEEVREALEVHKDEIHSAADLRNMTEELMLRQ